jgi:hypothetical protein
VDGSFDVHPFSPSLSELREFLNGVIAEGSGDAPEDFVGVIQEQESKWQSLLRE